MASTQRTYTAPCPGCGAPVEFRSAQSTHAVCSFCRSTVVRDGETLARIGKVGERFEDFSPLQLHARGVWRGGAFTLVGRLQCRGPRGARTEWNCLFDPGAAPEQGGSAAWLVEDHGSHVLAFPATSERALPEAERFRVGATTAFGGKSYQVTSNEQVALVSAEGELPWLPPLHSPFAMVALRSADNELLSLDYGAQPPALTRGRPVALQELQFTGLREGSARALQGRQFSCPHCGAPVQLHFADSKAVTCASCDALIDLAGGIGGELRHAVQHEPVQPLIPLGSTGRLQGVHWQVVGYQHRLGTEPDEPDEHFGWDEYLLFNRGRGFRFLVHSSDGWHMVKRATGAPTVSKDMQVAAYLGTTYRHQHAYKAQTTYVVGEFYRPVERGQATFHRDYTSGRNQLSLQETPRERTWSFGSTLDGGTVAHAFGLAAKKELFRHGDAGLTTPRGAGAAWGGATMVVVLLVLLILSALLSALEDGGGARGSGSTSSGARGGGPQK